MHTLKIFISSTIEDMHPERVAVLHTIQSLRLDPNCLETEYSDVSSSREKILDMVSHCDIYIGLYNHTRYGWEIPSDHISPTELEFNQA